jgi:preprotein translocase subunit SecD
MGKLKQIFTNWKVIFLLITIVLAVAAINPQPWREGAAIRVVEKNSPASTSGIENPKPGIPMSKEVITSLNNMQIKDSQEFYDYISQLKPNSTLQIKTNKDIYKIKVGEKINKTKTGKIINETIFNNETNETKIIQKEEILETPTGEAWVGIRVYDAPKSNIKQGLDLQGGTTVMLQPEEKVSEETMQMIIENYKQRLNIYGLSDTVVREASDMEDNKYIKIEIAGATEEEITELLGSRGKFEAKISNTTIFSGGEDIKFICRSPECSGPDPRQPCGKTGDGYGCQYYFSISLSTEAAQRQADTTQNLEVIAGPQGGYLNESLDLYLDGEFVETLKIGESLKGKVATDITISVGGEGATRQEASLSASQQMKKLQTILQTGSLPVKMKVVQTNQISPLLGQDFLKNSIFAGMLAMLAVVIVVFIKYREWQVAMPMILIVLSEVLLVLGIAAIIPGWTIDLAAIAGILIVLGTGVNDQIIIAEEIKKGEKEKVAGWKEMIKRAFFIIMTAYATLVVAMIPLFFAGAGLLKGFAVTTIIGASVGVFITRPAYSVIVEILSKK